jgi:hypothetical protein
LAKGCSDNREMQVLLVGAFVEGDLHLVMDTIVSYPIQCLFTLCIISFFFQEIVGGHCPGMVTSCESVTHKHFIEMTRLAHDETPLLLDMPPRAT